MPPALPHKRTSPGRMVKHSSSGRGETQRPRDIQKLARSKTSTKRRMLRAEKNEGIPQAKAPTPQPKKTKKKSKAGVARRKKKKGSGIGKLISKLCGGGKVPQVNRRSEELCNGVMLQPNELKKLRLFFDSIDIDGAGNIDFEEFFEAIDVPRTPFTEAIFTLIDDPTSLVKILTPEEMRAITEATGNPAPRVKGLCSFDDFVQVSCTYCMYSKEDILMFAFSAFDKDSSGVIDEQEFIELCATVNNMNPTYPGNFRRAMEEFDKNDDGNIDFEEFKALNRRYPMVLFPAFQLQDALQRKTLGDNGWIRVARRVQAEKDLEEYQRKHNGRMPPTKPLHKILCWLKPKRPRGIGGGVPKPNVPTARNLGKRLQMASMTRSNTSRKVKKPLSAKKYYTAGA